VEDRHLIKRDGNKEITPTLPLKSKKERITAIETGRNQALSPEE